MSSQHRTPKPLKERNKQRMSRSRSQRSTMIAMMLILTLFTLSSHSQTSAAGAQKPLTLDAVIAMNKAGVPDQQLAQLIVDQPKLITLTLQGTTKMREAQLPSLVQIAIVSPESARIMLKRLSQASRSGHQGLNPRQRSVTPQLESTQAVAANSQPDATPPTNQAVQPTPRQEEPIEDTSCFKSESQIPIGDESNAPKITGGAKGHSSPWRNAPFSA